MLRLAPIVILVLLGACGGEPDLMNFPASRQPDEFGVVPAKPLETPPDLTALPPPGGINRADATPRSDAIAALGGRPSAAELSGQAASGDGALLTHAGRFGRDPAIRATLAEEDLEFRSRNRGRVMDRLFNRNLYYDAYRNQQLDQQAEAARFRRAGVAVPAAPPPELRPQ